MQSANSNNSNSNSDGSAASAISFFQQGVSRRNSDSDIGTMDDIQFNASLDALLNGEQMAENNTANSSVPGIEGPPSGAIANNGNSYAPPIITQQPALHNSQQYLVAGSTAPMMATATTTTASGAASPQGPSPPASGRASTQQQAFPITTTHLAGLPLASANQAALHLAPPGPHSAAQMSLSAGHAAATGGFHPNAGSNSAAGLAQFVGTQTPLMWTIGASAPVPPQAQAPTAGPNSGVKPAPISSQPMAAAAEAEADGGGKRPRSGRDISAVSEDEGERQRRRQDRNLREQQRSHRITEQISELREVLSSANLQFKPDKYSTLTKVVEYIKHLQDKSRVLDVEHKKLLNTISETNEIVNSQYVPAYTSGSDAPSLSNDAMGGDGSSSLEEESMSFRGINYKIAFQGCGIPLALASIDGRFLDCNDTFLELTGYPREELLPLEKPGCENTVSFSPDQDGSQKKNLSLFNLLSRDGMDQVFMAMSEMLKQPGSIGTTAAVKTGNGSELADFWSGPVRLCRQDHLPVKLNVTLVRTSRGRPKFFNCALTALSIESGLRFDDQTTITTPSQSPSDATKETTTSAEQQQLLAGHKSNQEETSDDTGQAAAPVADQAGS